MHILIHTDFQPRKIVRTGNFLICWILLHIVLKKKYGQKRRSAAAETLNFRDDSATREASFESRQRKCIQFLMVDRGRFIVSPASWSICSPWEKIHSPRKWEKALWLKVHQLCVLLPSVHLLPALIKLPIHFYVHYSREKRLVTGCVCDLWGIVSHKWVKPAETAEKSQLSALKIQFYWGKHEEKFKNQK